MYNEALNKMAVKNTSGNFDVYDLGAEAENVKVSRDVNGEIITDITAKTVDDTEESLAETLKNIEENKSPNVAPLFDKNKTYSMGDYVTYKGDTYRYYSPEDKPPGEWDSYNFLRVYMGGQYVTAGKKEPYRLGFCATAEGDYTEASGFCSHAEGNRTKAIGECSHAEGDRTKATGGWSHAEGGYDSNTTYPVEFEDTTASGDFSHAEGEVTKAAGRSSHSEGLCTTASGPSAHAEGKRTIASGFASHAEGGYDSSETYPEGFEFTTASGDFSHAEGEVTKATGQGAHSEGYCTKADGYYSHAEGMETVASDPVSHAEGDHAVASHVCSHAEGYFTRTGADYQHVQGQYNVGKSNTLFEIGKGSSENTRSNAFEVNVNGNVTAAGDYLNAKGKVLVKEVLYDYTYKAEDDPSYSEAFRTMVGAIQPLEFNKKYEIELQVIPISLSQVGNHTYHYKELYSQDGAQINRYQTNPSVDIFSFTSQGYKSNVLKKNLLLNIKLSGTTPYVETPYLYRYTWSFEDATMQTITKSDIITQKIKFEMSGNSNEMIMYASKYKVRVILRAYEN